ncbi:MAG: chemotaxis protein, partial [Reinekea sp.]|nr:chemotaxis protein [Reinekea sp.]
NKAFKAQVHEARVVLIDESESGLALAKRAISAYMDSNGDKLHLSNVVATLHGVRGALVFLNSEQAASIVARAIAFVQRDLLESAALIDSGQLELFADALSSLEFYLEGLLSGNENLDILKLALHSLNNLKV